MRIDVPPSTGSTTHLFPYVLSLLYVMGATSSTIVAFTYILNSVFYLLIIWIVWLIARKMIPE